MNKIIINMGLAVFTVILLFCQSLQAQTNLSKNEIKDSGQYYWGEAVANSSKEASDLALSYLTQSISVQVSSTFEMQSKEVLSNSKTDFKEVSDNILKTYSTATLKNVESIRTPVDNKIEVFHFIKKSEVTKIYQERKQLVFNIYDQAVKFAKDANYGYALKWYYFSLILMNSIPEQNIKYHELNLTTTISANINSILQKVRLNLISQKRKNDKELEFKFAATLDDKPIQYLEFSFFDGYDLLNAQVTDGVAIVYLIGSSTQLQSLSLAVRYSYYEARNEINEVGQLWDLVQKPIFKNNIVLNLQEQKANIEKAIANKSEQDKADLTESNDEVIAVVNNADVIPSLTVSKITNSINTLTNLANKGMVDSLLKTYKSDAFLSSKLSSLFDYNGTTIVNEKIKGEINKTYDGFEYRKVTAVNKYGSLSKQTKEYLVFDFNKEGVLTDVNFGIIDDLYQKFVQQAQYGNDWKNRQVIIKFMERYRTAYMTRNLDMLSNMFADEAVIIVGRVLKKGQQKKNYDYVPIGENQPDVEYLRYTKTEYLKRQKQVFDAQKDIFLGFSNFNIMRKNNQEGVYGISLRQHYTATNYADEGYLFLLVDFNEEQPQIYVRSWQPQEWGQETLVKLANFNINK